jgi:hypothetical protein
VLALAAASPRGVTALVARADVLAVAPAMDGRVGSAHNGAVDVAGVDVLAHANATDGIDGASEGHGAEPRGE